MTISFVDVDFLIFLVVCPGPKHLNSTWQIKTLITPVLAFSITNLMKFRSQKGAALKSRRQEVSTANSVPKIGGEKLAFYPAKYTQFS
jgi:hypothetical protein